MTDDKFGDHHVVDQVICADRLAGYYIIDEPRGGPRRDGTEPGLLYVEKRSDGRWYDSELDCRITAREVVVAPPRLRVVGDVHLWHLRCARSLRTSITAYSCPTPANARAPAFWSRRHR